MPHEVIMPALGMNQDTGVIAAWHKKKGDSVKVGEVLMDIETDKAVMEIEAKKAGFITDVFYQEGEDVPVGQPVAYIGESVNTKKTPIEKTAIKNTFPPIDDQQSVINKDKKYFISPKAKKIAKEYGLDVEKVVRYANKSLIQSKEVLAYKNSIKKNTPPHILNRHYANDFSIRLKVEKSNFLQCSKFLLSKASSPHKSSGHLLASLASIILSDLNLIKEGESHWVKVDSYGKDGLCSSYIENPQQKRFSNLDLISDTEKEYQLHVLSFLGSHINDFKLNLAHVPTIVLSESNETLAIELLGFPQENLSKICSFSEKLAEAVESPMLYIV